MYISKEDYPKYLKNLKNYPPLNAGEELFLTQSWYESKDQNALDKLTMAYSRLVISIANRFKFYGIPMIDLIQEGYTGLLHAAEMFDPNRGVRFSAYAKWWIMAVIQDYVVRNWSIVRFSSTATQKHLFFSLPRLRAKLAAKDLHHLSTEKMQEIADHLKIPVNEVTKIESRIRQHDLSLNAPTTLNGNSYWQDYLVDERINIESTCAQNQEVEAIKKNLEYALNLLNDKEAYIVKERRLKDPPTDWHQLSQTLSITKDKVRQIEIHGLRKMRKILFKKSLKGCENK